MNATATFLTADDLAVLTGRKAKSRQVAALSQMGIPFFVNAIGHAVVARSAIEGRGVSVSQIKPAWVPPGMRKKQ